MHNILYSHEKERKTLRLWGFEADMPKKMCTFAAGFHFKVRKIQTE